MSEWNPVAGLEKVSFDLLCPGDVVVMKMSDLDVYSKVEISVDSMLSKDNTYYLLSRAKIKDPGGIGDVVEIFDVGVFIRTRNESEDVGCISDPWADWGNDACFSWEEIQGFMELRRYEIRKAQYSVLKEGDES